MLARLLASDVKVTFITSARLIIKLAQQNCFPFLLPVTQLCRIFNSFKTFGRLVQKEVHKITTTATEAEFQNCTFTSILTNSHVSTVSHDNG